MLRKLTLFLALAMSPCAYGEAGFHNDTELGIVILGGTTESESINIKQSNNYDWDGNRLLGSYRHMRLTSGGHESARTWGASLRGEREVRPDYSPFLAESVESDVYAGFKTRSNTDIGLKYEVVRSDHYKWHIEGGYRYAYEDRIGPPNKTYHLGRLYTEVNDQITPSTSAGFNFEYLPNFTETNAYRINGEVALNAAINQTFSLKMAYSAKYDNLPPREITQRFSTMFTTGAVAKF